MQSGRPRLLALLVANDERTHEEIIDGFNDCARRHGEDAALSPRNFRRWLNGEVQTQPRPAQPRVARLYWGYPMSQLLGPAPPELPPGDGVANPLPAAGNGADRDGARFPYDEFERRLAMASRRAARFITFAESQNVGPETVDQLRDRVGELARAYETEPLVAIVGDMVEVQEAIFGLLEGRQKPAATRDLYVLAGVATGLLSNTSHDLGRPHEAMAHARTMYVCADNADHHGLRAYARGQQSLIAYYAGRPQEAARYARAAEDTIRTQRGTVVSWLSGLEARAWAMVSDPDRARRAVARAEDARARVELDDLDAIGGLFTFPLAQQHFYAAGTYVHLDAADLGQAQAQAAEALALYEQAGADSSYSNEAITRTELALARVRLRDVEGARDALAPVLALPPEWRLGGIVTKAMQVHDALAEAPVATAAAASAVRDEIEYFARRPVAALPR